MPSSKQIHIVEVTARDGFQILPRVIPLEVKRAFIQSLLDAGCREIQAGSFVNPKWVPQMQYTAELCEYFRPPQKAVMTYMVPNLRGAQNAIDAGAAHFSLTISASEKHSRDNVNRTVDEAMADAIEVAKLAKERGVTCRGSIATAFGYAADPDGVSIERVIGMIEALEAAGFAAINMSDTSGDAHPDHVFELCSRATQATSLPLSVHLHQADGVEFANLYAAFQAGIRAFESAAGGLGGCPFAKGAKGNVATEKLVALFHTMGYDTGIDLERIRVVAERAKEIQRDYGTPECGA